MPRKAAAEELINLDFLPTFLANDFCCLLPVASVAQPLTELINDEFTFLKYMR